MSSVWKINSVTALIECDGFVCRCLILDCTQIKWQKRECLHRRNQMSRVKLTWRLFLLLQCLKFRSAEAAWNGNVWETPPKLLELDWSHQWQILLSCWIIHLFFQVNDHANVLLPYLCQDSNEFNLVCVY